MGAATVAEVCEARILLDGTGGGSGSSSGSGSCSGSGSGSDSGSGNVEGDPPVFDESEFVFTVPEDTPGEVGTVTATDPDDDISHYSLSGTGASEFSIDISGKITVATMLDYEGQTTYQFEVTVEDTYGHTDTALVTVNVTDVAEDPVFGGGDLEFGISEMAHSEVTVGVIPLTDPQNDITEIKVYQGDIDNPESWVETDAFKAAENNGQATLRVDDEWELDHESKPEWNLILKAIDGEGNSDTAEVKVTLSDELEWISTGVSIATYHVTIAGIGTGYHHTEIVIIPEDQQAYENDGRFTQTVWVHRQEMVYATVGAEKQGTFDWTLVSEVNRGAIDEDAWTQRGTVVTSGSTNDMINLIFTFDSQYGDDLDYDAIPGDPPEDGYNCNSYIRGLLNAVREEDNNVSYSFVPGPAGAGDFPGWERPVPLEEFGIDEE